MTGIEDQGDRATLIFANGETVTADLVIGADGIRSVVRQQLFTDKAPGVLRRARLPRGDLRRRRLRAGHRRQPPDVHRCKGTKVYLLPLRHRNQVSFDITALSDDDAWAPEVTKDDLMALLDGFDERLMKHHARPGHGHGDDAARCYDIDPVDTWHSDCVALVGDAAHAMLHHQGQGANSAIHGRRRRSPMR